MTEVISIRFKTCGKNYYFDPSGMEIKQGDRLIVETAKGLELVECTRANHMVEDTSVVTPLRPVVRIATAEDLRMDSLNKQREKDAFSICAEKIVEHGLDMKLVAVECSFEGNKITFFFTSDGRVDFRELVKDLASIFHNRIELRQIGVRDEAKMVGGIGICGRPFCCSQFLNDFAPVSTKMAKVQSLSLNPAKISGCCGRLMCCLRYEEDAYEDLLKTVPKQGAFVETPDGYGTATQIDLLRQMVKVKLDSESDDSLHLYKAAEVAVVPAGRPKDGETPPHVLNLTAVKESLEETETPEYVPAYFEDETEKQNAKEELELLDAEETRPAEAEEQKHTHKNNRNGRNRNRRNRKPAAQGKPETQPVQAEHPAQDKSENKFDKKYKKETPIKPANPADASPANDPARAETSEQKKKPYRRHRYYSNKKPKTTQQNN